MYDVVVIGAGAVGCCVARELSQYQLHIGVLEKEEDVCSGTSKANSGIVHAGFDAKPGSKKALLNVLGNQRMAELAQELDFSFRQNGSLVLCFQEEEIPKLEALLENGRQNGVSGLQILSGGEVRQMEPNLSPHVAAALYAPTGGIVCPFELTIAMAENACVNGVEFRFHTQVQAVEKQEKGFLLHTNQGDFAARLVINAAGLFSDTLHNMVSKRKRTIIPRKGEYCLMDKQAGGFVDKTIFQLPTQWGKGVLITPTVHGNLLIGPTALDILDPEDTATTAQGLAEVVEKAKRSAEGIPLRQVITSFAGLRAHEEDGDFVIGEAEDVPGFYDLLGIESPGLTSAPAIGELVAQWVAETLRPARNSHFVGTREKIRRVREAYPETVNQWIAENPAYGKMVCRCCQVTEGEIVDAIRRPLGARSMDGIKRRTRAGMGQCQAGFCTPKALELLARELGADPREITKAGEGSRILEQEGCP
ncbi:MAG: NAD(P)/FAD-dependent oxidoreductase [Clostridiales bacterium]|jgi:glycerol-3-phosphate dehydrogenase|nr:NAD(P)/FAD-dependent oxidoreductase [Clostridiales bacterium]